MELGSIETSSVRRREKLLDEARQLHTEEINVWIKTSAETVDSLIDDVKVAKADGVEMSVERNLILAYFEKHVRAL